MERIERINNLRAEMSDEIHRVLESSDVLRSIRELPIGSREELKEDLERLRHLVAAQRRPRLVIVGKDDVPLPEVMASLGARTEFEPVRERLGRGRWYEHDSPRGGVLVADLRSDGEPSLKPIEYQQPDAVIASVAELPGRLSM